MTLSDLYNLKNRCHTEIEYLEEKIDKEHFEGEILAPVLDYINKLEEMVEI